MGIGDISDEKRGLDTISKAAEMGVMEAQFKLLGLSAISNNMEEARKWYSYIINASFEDSIFINCSNPNLVDICGERIDSVIQENSRVIILTINEALNAMCYLQIKEKKPYAAIKLCDEFFGILSSRNGMKNDKELAKYMDGIKYYIFAETGNISQAIKISHKKSYKSIGSKRDFEIMIPFSPINVYFRPK